MCIDPREIFDLVEVDRGTYVWYGDIYIKKAVHYKERSVIGVAYSNGRFFLELEKNEKQSSAGRRKSKTGG